MLDKEGLERLKAQALEQRDKYVQMLHEANGAIGMLDFLLAQLDQAPSEEEQVDG